MRPYLTFRPLLLLTVILLTTLLCNEDMQAQESLFTAVDAFNMVNESARDMTTDGRYLVMTSASRKDRSGADHKRYRDPSYVSPSFTDLRVLDTETGESWSLFGEKIILTAMDLSPDNSKLAVIIYRDNEYRLYLYDLAGRKLRPVKAKMQKKLASNSDLLWTPDNSSLLVSLRAEGWKAKADSAYAEATTGPRIVYDASRPFLKWDEIANINALNIPALINLSTGSVTELLPEGNYSSIRFASQGNRMNYMVVKPEKTVYERGKGTKYGLFSLDIKDNARIDTLFDMSYQRRSVTWNGDNTMFAFADSGRVMIRSLFEKEAVRLSVDTTEIVKEDTVKVKFSVMRWSPDQSKVLAGSGTGYWLLDINTREMQKVYQLPADEDKAPGISIAEWSPDGQSWYMTYSARDKWERGLVKYNLATGEFTDLFKDSNLYNDWMMSKDGSRFVYRFSDGDHPSEYYTCDDSFKNPVQLTNSNPQLAGKKFTRSELVKYLDADGKELYGILYYPVDYVEGRKYPLVCEIYETFFDNGFNANMNILAGSGFFGFRPSVNLIEGYPGEAWIKGITSGINQLIERGLVDPDRLGVHGTSYGGYATSLLITQTDRFAAAINISGKVNIISFLGDSPRIGTRNYSAAENGQDRIGEALWDAPLKYFNTTAVLYADRIKTPHLLLTGEGDWNVPGVNTRELYYAMRRLGKEVVWVNYFNGGHGAGWASDEEDYYDQWTRILEWYTRHFEKSDGKPGRK